MSRLLVGGGGGGNKMHQEGNYQDFLKWGVFLGHSFVMRTFVIPNFRNLCCVRTEYETQSN